MLIVTPLGMVQTVSVRFETQDCSSVPVDTIPVLTIWEILLLAQYYTELFRGTTRKQLAVCRSRLARRQRNVDRSYPRKASYLHLLDGKVESKLPQVKEEGKQKGEPP